MILDSHEDTSDLRREIQENRAFIIRILQAVEKASSDCQSQTSNVMKRVDGLESRLESLEHGLKLQSEHTRSLLIALEAQGETVRDLREQLYSVQVRLEDCAKDHKSLSRLEGTLESLSSRMERRVESAFTKLEEQEIRLERHVGDSSLQAAKLKQEVDKELDAQRSLQDHEKERMNSKLATALEGFRVAKQEMSKTLEQQESRLSAVEKKVESVGSLVNEHDVMLSEQLKALSQSVYTMMQEQKSSFDRQLRSYKTEIDPRMSKLEGRLRSLSPDVRVEHSSKAAEQKAEIQARISRLEKAWPTLHPRAAATVVPKSYDGAPGTPTFDRMHTASYLDGTDLEISRSENTEIVSPPLNHSVLH